MNPACDKSTNLATNPSPYPIRFSLTDQQYLYPQSSPPNSTTTSTSPIVIDHHALTRSPNSPFAVSRQFTIDFSSLTAAYTTQLNLSNKFPLHTAHHSTALPPKNPQTQHHCCHCHTTTKQSPNSTSSRCHHHQCLFQHSSTQPS
ncbi:Hypothetical predicted protein [Olea europaea subsp. europaea]|uniref:Uncharacterized protein n=1 Tax=Olea europaea subsp. europaea TaxID=158383 RepID=A0A8S0UBZ3_OLEEU|nr:Hypothetical predicted protein [Olea europaea subsp. europaea]